MKTLWAAALLLAACSTPAAADTNYPVKPVKLVLPFPTGATFVVGQMLAETMTRELGEAVVIENKSGAGGRIAMEHVARAPADGYTLLLASPTLTITPAINQNLRFDPLADLAPVAKVAEVPNVFVVNPQKFGQADFDALRKQLAAHPGKFSYGSGGAGSSNHLAFEKFKALTGTDILHVPYQGASQAVTSAVGGQIDMVINGLPNSAPLIKGQQLKAMFVLTRERQPLLPDVPSAVEVGLPDMVVTTWYGVLAPKGTPAAIVDKLARAIKQGLSAPEVRRRLADNGIDYVYSGPGEFSAFIKDDYAGWKKVVAEAAISIQN
ncbi:MAG: tripartite tricarboxylate transporter substrate-binding protein [Pigmentiphaga sp.]|uniref:Bug family tripartite tricarboxylate transporter substrate binding protein n=1 Tax=Pigmentiphaga sp. TaxID=1977564 RepID=UPI0029AEDB3E|nr:tripartite tricarboxylate transporter substrate-binding protein [Pigmentiphaga sp.]MDX3905167.1 tripartite tricarboxylate transporter substrate-binding protein [Pigmentiphaga sp.]